LKVAILFGPLKPVNKTTKPRQYTLLLPFRLTETRRSFASIVQHQFTCWLNLSFEARLYNRMPCWHQPQLQAANQLLRKKFSLF